MAFIGNGKNSLFPFTESIFIYTFTSMKLGSVDKILCFLCQVTADEFRESTSPFWTRHLKKTLGRLFCLEFGKERAMSSYGKWELTALQRRRKTQLAWSSKRRSHVFPEPGGGRAAEDPLQQVERGSPFSDPRLDDSILLGSVPPEKLKRTTTETRQDTADVARTLDSSVATECNQIYQKAGRSTLSFPV